MAEPPRSDGRFQTATHWGVYDLRVADGRIAEAIPSPLDRDPSEIGRSIPGVAADALRIRRPAIREGYLRDGPAGAARRGQERFVELPWAEAIDRAAAALADVKARAGNAAIFGGSYGWSSAGRFHHAQSQIHRFLNLFGGYTRSENSYSMAALEVMIPHLLGIPSLQALYAAQPHWREIRDHGGLMLCFGGMARKNMQANPGGIGRHALGTGLAACRAAGVRFVNIGPYRDDVDPGLDPDWLPIRPCTDVALMLALIHQLIATGRHDAAFVADCCTGGEELQAYLFGAVDGIVRDAAWAAAITGLPAATIAALAADIAASRTLINISWSLQRQDHGEQPIWAAIALAAFSGSMGRRGGGFAAGYGTIGAIGADNRQAGLGSFAQGSNPIDSMIPVARITDMLEHPGEAFAYDGVSRLYPDIRLIYWCGGNPFHHHQHLARFAAAWQRPETIIVHETAWNPIARHADIVFPAAMPFERNDIAGGYLDPTLVAMREAVAPIGEARTDYDILAALSRALGFEPAFTEGRSERQWLEYLYADTRAAAARQSVALPDFDAFWAEGRFEYPEQPRPDHPVALLRRDPARHRLATPSGRIALFSEAIAALALPDCPGHPAWIEPGEWLGATAAARHPLHLLSNQPSTRLHSQLDHGLVSRRSKIRGREPLKIHPGDAAARGLADGDVVLVRNDRGACLAGVRIDDRLIPGVVHLATGAWLDLRDIPGIGAICVHGNPNMLTVDRGTSQLAQGPIANGCLVEVARWDRPLPPVTAFDPPEIIPIDKRS